MRSRLGHPILPISFLLTACGAFPLQADAAGGVHRHPHRAPAAVAVTFRLHVSGKPASDTTFWVAYGPLAGRFGLVQLHPSGAGVYSATQTLPTQGRTTFAYLAGRGAIQSRFGPAPGDPVTIIQRIGPVSARELDTSPITWTGPVG
jgi:hypothetical protein